ncbi:hypothetical protein EWM64_g2222 [Hericium alpestre]|uniref:Alginate lyase domain-containing protein n=1 Tax=Hericium alpestre TaxID=135208 RepID=A0A4Z0A788_9AGAM|nr:hypothetical protein EWM64_g2222 [Hericium alpestre]
MQSWITLGLAVACGFSAVSAAPAVADGFGESEIALVKKNAQTISTHSWELGTLAEALTELESPRLSVFSAHSIPPPAHLKPGEASDVLNLAANIVANKTPSSGPLIDGDGAAGDPASLGAAVLLRNWTREDLSDLSFAQAATGQLKYLLDVVPRVESGPAKGAISQRDPNEPVQLWADYVYMVPPFIAYYGALEGGDNGKANLAEAYNQCRTYRAALFDGNTTTTGGTGNAWAAAGMMRVLTTIANSPFNNAMQKEQSDLKAWINEIFTGAWACQKDKGELYNYIDQDSSFPDSSSTALLAATTFRYISLTQDYTHIVPATRALGWVRKNVDKDGWLLNTVDPESFSTPSGTGTHSPEGQSFVLLLHSAWKAFHGL